MAPITIGSSRMKDVPLAGTMPHPERAEVLDAERGIVSVKLSFIQWRARRFGQQQSVTFRIVCEDLGISAPVQCRVDLAFDIFMGEVFVEHITEKYQRNRVIGFPFQRITHLLNELYVLQQSVAKQLFAGTNIGLCKSLAGRRNRNVSLR